MKIGFTGTQSGLSEPQQKTLRSLLAFLNQNQIIEEGHHGDCVGADCEFNAELVRLGIPIVLHPPILESKRAFCDKFSSMKDVRPKRDYLDRNQRIVDEVDLVFSTPKSAVEEKRSGTWFTSPGSPEGSQALSGYSPEREVA